MKITAEPRSDQWNAEDFIQGPRTFAIAGAREGAAEQKYDIVLEGSDRVWRPPVTVLRILIAAWGNETEQWVGHRATLYRDESIRFGKDQPGGIRVSHLSHIDKPLRINLSEKRGSRKLHTVQPLVETAPPAPPDLTPILAAIHTAPTLPDLQSAWQSAGKAGVQGHPDVVAAKDARKGELSA